MSGITIPHQTALNIEVIVGWDPNLATFFAQVKDLDAEAAAADMELEEGEEPILADPLLLWVGADYYAQLETVEELKPLLAEYADISDEVAAALREDQLNRPAQLTRITRSLIHAGILKVKPGKIIL